MDNTIQKGLPIDMIKHIRRGHKNTTLLPKVKNKYGQATKNNVGVFQGSAISALLFIIYQDDVMEDYTALNHEENLTLKHTIERQKRNRPASEQPSQATIRNANQGKKTTIHNPNAPRNTNQDTRCRKNTRRAKKIHKTTNGTTRAHTPSNN